ncbi:MAG: nucleotide exchange factor GrpE, partial [Anaerolineae bacterium]
GRRSGDLDLVDRKDRDSARTATIAEDTSPPRAPDEMDATSEEVIKAFEEENAAANRRADENWDKFLRAQAELENYRRAAERRRTEAALLERRRLLTAILDLADNLERALDHSASGTEELAAGVEATYRELRRLLEKEGVAPIDAMEGPFDPNLHEAVSVVSMPGIDADTVVSVEQGGYTLNGDLLRPARVVVGRPADEAVDGDAKS